MASFIALVLMIITYFTCFLLLLILTEAFGRLMTNALQSQARIHFTWPSDSPFNLHTHMQSHHTSLQDSSPLLKARCDAELSITHYKKRDMEGSNEREVECVFCLCEIEEGEEIRELRCKHLFHRSCLDRWLEHWGATCPLCRDCLVPCEGKEKFAQMDEEDQRMDLAMVVVANVNTSGWWM